MSNIEQLFVIGYPRSGTTYLLHLLLSSGYYPLYNFTETHFYSHYYRRYGSLKKDKNFERLCQDIITSSWFNNSDLTSDEFINNIERREYGAVLSSFMNTITKKQNKKRWVEKTPWHCRFVREILKDFPNAKFILIVRDPRDVIISITNREFKTGILNGVTRIAIAWRWHMERVIKDLYIYKAKFIHIKYEDLVTDLDNAVRQINTFLDISINTEILKTSLFGVLGNPNTSFKKKNLNANNYPVYRWHNYLNLKELSLIELSVSNELKKWGYDNSGIKTNLSDKTFVFFVKNVYYFYKKLRSLMYPYIQK